MGLLKFIHLSALVNIALKGQSAVKRSCKHCSKGTVCSALVKIALKGQSAVKLNFRFLSTTIINSRA